jgi:hypothetical protein
MQTAIPRRFAQQGRLAFFVAPGELTFNQVCEQKDRAVDLDMAPAITPVCNVVERR